MVNISLNLGEVMLKEVVGKASLPLVHLQNADRVTATAKHKHIFVTLHWQQGLIHFSMETRGSH